ncbi:hypothetical protein [Nostoc sp.]|uniref:hypothetical protein n=1 Tax=Nostoc sp. TaxID=1180 RepID=UPI002FFB0D51
MFYACNNNPANEIVATYYEINPPIAQLERGDTTIAAIVTISPSSPVFLSKFKSEKQRTPPQTSAQSLPYK